jgi:amino acid transporter
MYTMGRAGTLPGGFGRIHPRHQTPTLAIAFVQLSGIAAILLVGLLLKPETIFGFLETIATLAVIVLYVMANLALTRYMRRERRAPLDRELRSFTRPVRHRLPGTLVALQPNAVPVSRSTHRRLCLHAVVRVAQSRSASQRCNDAH